MASTTAEAGKVVSANLEDDQNRNGRRSDSRDRRDASLERRDRRGGGGGGRGRSRSRDRRRRRGSPGGRRGRSRDRRRNRSRSNSPAADPLRCNTEEEARMRDAKCVFVTQLQVKATEGDVEFHFGLFCKVVEVALIKEKTSGRSKGFGYVELATMDDVAKALLLNGLPFVWRDGTKGFPIVVRPSEAYRLFLERGTVMAPQTDADSRNKASTQKIELVESSGPGSARCRIDGGPIVLLPTHRGKPMNTRILYVGNLHKTLTDKDLREIFSSFGAVESVQLKVDPTTQHSKGFAFVKFSETSIAAAANERLNGYELMGLQLICNPVNDRSMDSGQHPGSTSGSASHGGDDSWGYLDDDARGGGGRGVALGADKRMQLMSQLAGGAVAQEMLSKQQQPQSQHLQPPQQYSRKLLISNMFRPEEETAPDWAREIERDTFEECERFGRVRSCVVDEKDPRGLVTVVFEGVEDAKKCAASMQGRYFSQRQIQVQFLPE